MGSMLQAILDWSEVWAITIPLLVILFNRQRHHWQKPIITYVVLAFFLNIWIDLIWIGNRHDWFELDNNILYNIHSLIRLFLFSWFFNLISSNRKLYLAVSVLFAIASIVIFIRFDRIQEFSSILMALESAILLFYCLYYFISVLRSEKSNTAVTSPYLFFIIGLTLYTAVNFFIFLFYEYLTENYRDYAIDIWDIHNIAYIVFCVLIAHSLNTAKSGA